MTMTRVREQNGTVKKRRDSRTSKDVLDEAQARHKLKILAIMALFAQQQDVDPTPYMVCALVNGLIIEDIQRDRNSLTAPIERKYLNFENANPDTFRTFYRFHQDEMPRLLRSLAIPAEFRLDNGSWVNGQEALMVMLRLLAYPLRYLDVEEAFGWETSRLCRIKVMMIKWVYSNHKHRVRDYFHVVVYRVIWIRASFM